MSAAVALRAEAEAAGVRLRLAGDGKVNVHATLPNGLRCAAEVGESGAEHKTFEVARV